MPQPNSPSTAESLVGVHPNAAGLDIGAREIWACVPQDRAPEPVRMFGTFTPDLNALVDWLIACGVATIAMESTGVFWRPIYNLLEGHHPAGVRSAHHPAAACLFLSSV